MNTGINALLDECRRILSCKNDAAPCRALDVSPPVISKLGACAIPLGAVMIISIHEVTGMSVRDIKRMAGASLSAPEIARNVARGVIAAAARQADRQYQTA